MNAAFMVLVASGLTIASIVSPQAGSAEPRASAEPARYPQPTAGKWKLGGDIFESVGSLRVKPGKNGKLPKVVKLKFKGSLNGAEEECLPPGTVLKVNGSIKLIKGVKWGSEDRDHPNPSAWISAKKDKKPKYSDPNMLGMKPRPVSLKVGSEKLDGELSMSFVWYRQDNVHLTRVSVRYLPPGNSPSDDCTLFSDGNPK